MYNPGSRNNHLDLPEGDEQALLELGVEAQQLGRLLEVPAGGRQCVHPARRNSPSGAAAPEKEIENPTSSVKSEKPNHTRQKD